MSSVNMEERRMLRDWCERHKVPLISSEALMILHLKGTHKTELGAGGYGSCYLLQDGAQLDYVVKTYKRDGPKALRDLKQEAHFLRTCQGSWGVQRLVGVCVENQTLVSHNAGTQLFRFLAVERVTPQMALGVVAQVIRTTCRLGRLRVAHNDIREVNVCVRRHGMYNDELLAQLIDFGMARYYGQQFVDYKIPESYNCADWIAPELLEMGPSSEASEVFSIGKMALRMAQRSGGDDLFGRVFGDYLNKATAKNPADRPSLQNLLDAVDRHGIGRVGKDCPRIEPPRVEVPVRGHEARPAAHPRPEVRQAGAARFHPYRPAAAGSRGGVVARQRVYVPANAPPWRLVPISPPERTPPPWRLIPISPPALARTQPGRRTPVPNCAPLWGRHTPPRSPSSELPHPYNFMPVA